MAKHFKHKFKKRMGRRVHKGVSNLLSVYKFKVAAVAQFANSTGAAATQGANFPINYPGNIVTNSGAWTQIGSVTPELARLMACFNEYRVKSLKVQFYPANVDTTAVSNTSIVANMLYKFIDETDVSDIITEDVALSSGVAPKGYSDGRVQRYTMKQFKSNRNRWFYTEQYTQSPGVAPSAYSLVPIQNAYASMKIFLQGIPATQTAGTLRIEWDCEFRGQPAN